MESLLFQAFVYLSAAVIAVPIAKRLGLGSVLGYLLAGIIIGPVIGLVGTETKDLQHFAEFGVVMMLFLVGLELEPAVLWRMRFRLTGLGGFQTWNHHSAHNWLLHFLWSRVANIACDRFDLCPLFHGNRPANPQRKRPDEVRWRP